MPLDTFLKLSDKSSRVGNTDFSVNVIFFHFRRFVYNIKSIIKMQFVK